MAEKYTKKCVCDDDWEDEEIDDGHLFLRNG